MRKFILKIVPKVLTSSAQHEDTIMDFKRRLHDLYGIMESARSNKDKNAVTLSTIHSCKGLEFKKVYIFDLVDGLLPSSGSIKEFDEGKKFAMEEEARLFYVGITRAKQYLELIIPRTIDGNKATTSRFVKRLSSICKKQIDKIEQAKQPIKIEQEDEGEQVEPIEDEIELQPVASKNKSITKVLHTEKELIFQKVVDYT